MEENKSKKSVGIPLVIIAILIISIACCVFYISKLNAEVEKLESDKENVINTQISSDNRGNDISKKQESDKNTTKTENAFEELAITVLEDYVYGLRNIDKFDDISKANLEQVVYYSIKDANLYYRTSDEEYKLNSIDNIIESIESRFDLSDSTIKTKIANMALDPYKAIYYNDNYDGDVNFYALSKIIDVSCVGDNRYVIETIQAEGTYVLDNRYPGAPFIEMAGVQIYDNVKETIKENDEIKFETYADEFKSYSDVMLEYAKQNNIGHRIYTIEINDNIEYFNYPGGNATSRLRYAK